MKNKILINFLFIIIVVVIMLIVIFVLNKNNNNNNNISSSITNNQVANENINDTCINAVKNMENNGLYIYNTELKSTTFTYSGEINGKYLVKTNNYDVYISKTDFSIESISYDLAGSITEDTEKNFMNTLAFMRAKDKYISNTYDEKYNLKNYVYGNPLTDVNYDNTEIVKLKIYESADDSATAIGKLIGEFTVNFKTEAVTFTKAK